MRAARDRSFVLVRNSGMLVVHPVLCTHTHFFWLAFHCCPDFHEVASLGCAMLVTPAPLFQSTAAPEPADCIIVLVVMSTAC
jgi:hypothetical protein